MSAHCIKCLRCYSEEQIGQPCETKACNGNLVTRAPEFHELFDELPEHMTCGRRIEDGMADERSPFRNAGPNLDRWQKFKSNGDRVCSYCGSLHPDDFFNFLTQAIDQPEDTEDGVDIHGTDKGYKYYVCRKDVRNAHEGGIKFYTQHLEPDGGFSDEQRVLLKRALTCSNIRHEKSMQKFRNSLGIK